MTKEGLKKIILVGLPGCGKSTLGKVLAAQFHLPFVDLDRVIEQEEGMPIPQIFSLKGEDYFRELEAAWLRKTLNRQGGMVLATGGGAPCFYDNMDLIMQKGQSIYIEVPFGLLAKRLFAEGVEKRPLLKGIKEAEGLIGLLEEKFAYRIPFYKKADLHFRNTSAIEELVEKIQARINSSGQD